MADARVIHFEITGKDAKGLQRYYSDLFGWALDVSGGSWGIAWVTLGIGAMLGPVMTSRLRKL